MKAHSGTSSSKGAATPDVDELAKDFAEKLKVPNADDDVPDFAPVASVQLMSFRITKRRVFSVLNGLDGKKSMMNISPMLLKNCADVLTDATYSLFKLIADQAEWPEKWGTSRVIGVHKRDSKADAKNYRPIAGLDNLSLAFERVIDPQFDRWIYKFIPECQFGFRKKCGTDDYGAAVTAVLSEALERLWEVLLISLDVAGAFDKVWWKALIKNLEHCGMGGRALDLFKSYLSNRKFRVVANGVASALMEYFAGVPQGAIWSPKLWNFHIRELVNVVMQSMLMKYADDSALMKIIERVNDRSRSIEEVNSDLEAIANWGRKWKVQFEPKKTHAMLVTRKKPGMPQPEMDGKKIAFVSSLKLVGFTIDSKLNWKKMACAAAAKGRSMIGALYRLQSLLKPSDLEQIYTSFIRSKMEFGSVEFIAAAPTHLARLDRVQRAAEKMCGCTFSALADRREAAVFSLLCKLLDGECVSPLQKFCPCFESKVVGSNSDAKTRLQKEASKDKRMKLEQKQNQHRDFSLLNYKWSWQGQAADIFNKIPEELKEKGRTTSWSKVKTAGKAFLNKSALHKQETQKRKKKSKPKTRATSSTGDLKLDVKLSAKMFKGIGYAAKWNANKTQCLS